MNPQWNHYNLGDILVISEALDDVRAIRQVLETEGYSIRLEETSHDAFSAVKNNDIALVLIDSELHTVDGYEICRALTNSPETALIPKVFLMASKTLNNLEDVYQAGASAFIVKPIQKDNLLTTISTHLELLYTRYVRKQYDELVQLVPDELPVLESEVSLGIRQGEAGFSSEELFLSVFEQSPMAIELLSPDGQIRKVNAAWQRLWDVAEDDTPDILAAYNMLSDTQIEELGIALLVQRAFAGEPVILPVIRYSGNLATDEIGLVDISLRAPWIQCYLYPIKDANGDVICVVNFYIDESLAKDMQNRKSKSDIKATSAGLDALTPREYEVLTYVITGMLNKQIARELAISEVTVKVHRGRIMRKLRIDSVAELVRTCERAGILPANRG